MTPRATTSGEPLQFTGWVALTKFEAFEACQTCADAERALLRGGSPVEAARLSALFDLLEDRLVARASSGPNDQLVCDEAASSLGSNSSDSEFTQ
jgi:hypothetical protein